MPESRIKNTLIISIARFSNILVTIALYATLSRIITDRSLYGALRQLFLIYSLLSGIFAIGVPQSIFYFLPRYSGAERKGLLVQNILILFVQGLFLGIVLFLLSNWMGSIFHSQYLPKLLRNFAFYPIFALPTFSVEAVLVSYGQVGRFVLFSVVSKVSTFLSLVVPVLFNVTIASAILIWDAAGLCIMVFSLVLVLSPVWKEELKWNVGMLRRELKYSIPLAGAAVLGSIIAYTDKIIVSRIMGAEGYAIYANGAIELPLIAAISGSVQTVLMADFSKKSKQEAYNDILTIWHRAVFKTSLALLPLWGFLFFWARDFIIFLFSSRYEMSYPIFAIYNWMIPAKIFSFSSILLPLGASLVFTEITMANAIFTVLITPLLAYYFGSIGAALGTIIVCWIVFFYGISRGAPVAKTTFKGFLPWGKLIVLSIVVLLSGISSKFLGEAIWNFINFSCQTGVESFVRLLIGGVFFAVLYMIGLEVTGCFPVIECAKLRFTKIEKYKD